MPTFDGNIGSESFVSGLRVLSFNEIDSTNRLAERLVQKGVIQSPTAITAFSQLAGRGQMQTKWHDEPGNSLLLTLVLSPRSLRISEQFHYNMAVALSVCDTIESHLQTEVRIKWPNDILVRRRKISGILIENSVRGDSIERSLVGIGVNLHQRDFPDEVPNATSFFLEDGGPPDQEALILEIFERFQVWEYKRLRGKLPEIKEAYVSKLMGFGQTLSFGSNQGDFIAEFTDITADGKVLLTRDGIPQAFGLKEVTWKF
ncbi:MAG: biotin--[acetyl-CoA-carboxylase] ligase [Bacteroidota bacterium]|nr:biotin--[acetyl-CoA-carboxylase] ligase [Bacteroidota bacterium]